MMSRRPITFKTGERVVAETQPGLLEFVSRQWGSAGVHVLRTLPGRRSSPLLLEDASGRRLVLRRFPFDPTGGPTRANLDLHAGLRRAGAPVPALVPTLEGATGVCYHASILALETYVPGRAARVTMADSALAGRALAEFHAAAHSIPAPHNVQTLDVRHLVEAPAEVLAAEPALQAPTLASAVRDISAELAVRTAAVLQRTSAQVVHGDAHRANMLVTPNDGVILIDLQDVGLGPPEYDLATFVWGLLDRRSPSSIWASFLSTYSDSGRSLDPGAVGVLIAARHVWWLSLRSRTWDSSVGGSTRKRLFVGGLELLGDLVQTVLP